MSWRGWLQQNDIVAHGQIYVLEYTSLIPLSTKLWRNGFHLYHMLNYDGIKNISSQKEFTTGVLQMTSTSPDMPPSPDTPILFCQAEIFALLHLLSHIPNLPAILGDLPSRLQAATVLGKLGGQEVSKYSLLILVIILFICTCRTLAGSCRLMYPLAWLPQEHLTMPLLGLSESQPAQPGHHQLGLNHKGFPFPCWRRK